MLLFHALAWEASEKSSYKEQTSLSICWGVERGRRRDEKEKIPITEVLCFLDVTLTYLLEASKIIVFLMCFKNQILCFHMYISKNLKGFLNNFHFLFNNSFQI